VHAQKIGAVLAEITKVAEAYKERDKAVKERERNRQ